MNGNMEFTHEQFLAWSHSRLSAQRARVAEAIRQLPGTIHCSVRLQPTSGDGYSAVRLKVVYRPRNAAGPITASTVVHWFPSPPPAHISCGWSFDHGYFGHMGNGWPDEFSAVIKLLCALIQELDRECVGVRDDGSFFLRPLGKGDEG